MKDRTPGVGSPEEQQKLVEGVNAAISPSCEACGITYSPANLFLAPTILFGSETATALNEVRLSDSEDNFRIPVLVLAADGAGNELVQVYASRPSFGSNSYSLKLLPYSVKPGWKNPVSWYIADYGRDGLVGLYPDSPTRNIYNAHLMEIQPNGKTKSVQTIVIAEDEHTGQAGTFMVNLPANFHEAFGPDGRLLVPAQTAAPEASDEEEIQAIQRGIRAGFEPIAGFNPQTAWLLAAEISQSDDSQKILASLGLVDRSGALVVPLVVSCPKILVDRRKPVGITAVYERPTDDLLGPSIFSAMASEGEEQPIVRLDLTAVLDKGSVVEFVAYPSDVARRTTLQMRSVKGFNLNHHILFVGPDQTNTTGRIGCLVITFDRSSGKYQLSNVPILKNYRMAFDRGGNLILPEAAPTVDKSGHGDKVAVRPLPVAEEPTRPPKDWPQAAIDYQPLQETVNRLHPLGDKPDVHPGWHRSTIGETKTSIRVYDDRENRRLVYYFDGLNIERMHNLQSAGTIFDCLLSSVTQAQTSLVVTLDFNQEAPQIDIAVLSESVRRDFNINESRASRTQRRLNEAAKAFVSSHPNTVAQLLAQIAVPEQRTKRPRIVSKTQEPPREGSLAAALEDKTVEEPVIYWWSTPKPRSSEMRVKIGPTNRDAGKPLSAAERHARNNQNKRKAKREKAKKKN